MRTFLSAFACILLLASAAAAIPTPELVIEDTLVLAAPVASVYLDTTHFAGPTLLVGTSRNDNSLAFAYTIRTNPLRIGDIIYQAHHPVLRVRAGYVNDDSDLDVLAALSTRYGETPVVAALVALYGPDYATVDTTTYSSGVKDMLVIDSSHEVLVGNYISFYDHGNIGEDSEYLVTYTLGNVLKYADLDSIPDTLIDSVAGEQFYVADVYGAGESTLGGLWIRFDWRTSSEFHAPDPMTWQLGGFFLNSTDGSVDSSTLVIYQGEESLDYGWYPGYEWPSPIGDLNGDEKLEVAISWYKWHTYGWEESFIAVYSLATQTLLWQWESYDYYTKQPRHLTMWDLDGDHVNDILVTPQYVKGPVTTISGLRGLNGDSLFQMEVRNPFVPLVAGDLDQSGTYKGVFASRDTLFVFRLDPSTGVHHDGGWQPEAFELHPNYPNPFNASTEIEYSLDAPGEGRLQIFNVLGQFVRTLVDEPLPAGRHHVTWDGTDAAGAAVASGVYFYRLTVGEMVKTRKLLLLK